jgi:DnaJ-class molecular chaperone
MFRLGRIRIATRSASTSSSSQDYYATLGISPLATQKEVKSAFYELSKRYHPDRNPGVEGASVKFNEVGNFLSILEEYTLISDCDCV